jgi:Sulfotransferase family
VSTTGEQTALPPLEADVLMGAAAAQSGLDDFGDPLFADGLERYLAAVKECANLNEVGQMTVVGDVLLNLLNRLRFEADLTRYPEILDQEVLAPVVITGLMRTGTTKLQHVLAADPDVWSLKFWQALNPAPFPDARSDGADPRIAFAEQIAAMTAETNPAMMTVHPPLPMEAEEELYLQRICYRSHFNGLVDYVPTYMWWVYDNIDHSYDYLYTMLQYLQWQQGGGTGRPWVLKSPWHLGNLDQLVRVFPEVTIVQTHRDPCEAVASTARLFDVVHHSRGNQVTAEMEGELWLGLLAEAMRRNLRQREQLAGRVEIVDVAYADVVCDVQSVVREVYARAGRELTPAAAAVTSGWEESHPQGRFGKNEYTMADFGLTRERIEGEFVDYLDDFWELVR